MSLRSLYNLRWKKAISQTREDNNWKNIDGKSSDDKSPCTQRQHILSSFDWFSFSPVYEHTSYSSFVGVTCSFISIATLLLYFVVTLKDFILQPPELVKQGSVALPAIRDQVVFEPPPIALEISYSVTDENSGNRTKYKADITNLDPYFRYKFTAKTIQEQDNLERIYTDIPGVACSMVSGSSGSSTSTNNNLLCPDQELRLKQKIQGMYILPVYQYVEVEIEKCTLGRHSGGCAPSEEIDTVVANGDLKVVLYLKEETFDTSKYHDNIYGGYNTNQKRGFDTQVQSWRFYGLPGLEQLTEIYMQGRSIRVEERYIGSPPLVESTFDLISFHSLSTIYRPASIPEPSLMSFYFRLYPQTSEEELEYWIRSLLDLFGYWGAMTSFLSVCSFGVFAKWYNRWKFNSNFRSNTPNAIDTPSVLSNQSYNDKCVDIRLFNQEDFDKTGRFKMTKEEFYFPSTPYGEVRKIALIEHSRKRKAAETIGKWYKERIAFRETMKHSPLIDPPLQPSIWEGSVNDKDVFGGVSVSLNRNFQSIIQNRATGSDITLPTKTF
jgi:hypothetical protein